MILVREQQENNLKRRAGIPGHRLQGQNHAQNVGIIDIDESGLSWFYIAPGCADTESCRRLLTFARDLLGPNAWAVLQAGDAQCHALCRELGLRIVESYENEADAPSGVSVHIVQTTQPSAHL
jgi:hypothetical protein